jgi:hypothetical protein
MRHDDDFVMEKNEEFLAELQQEEYYSDFTLDYCNYLHEKWLWDFFCKWFAT